MQKLHNQSQPLLVAKEGRLLQYADWVVLVGGCFSSRHLECRTAWAQFSLNRITYPRSVLLVFSIHLSFINDWQLAWY